MLLDHTPIASSHTSMLSSHTLMLLDKMPIASSHATSETDVQNPASLVSMLTKKIGWVVRLKIFGLTLSSGGDIPFRFKTALRLSSS
jgi:hypothetical protein